MQTAANGFATMLHIYQAEYVSQESPINIRLRGIAAFGMALGILLGGWRLVPVSGATICMTLVFVKVNQALFAPLLHQQMA